MSSTQISTSADHASREDDSESASSQSYDSEDNNFEDWVSPSQLTRPCRSLFDDREFASLAEALEDAKTNHQLDFDQLCTRLELDFYERTRLVNYLRKTNPSPHEIQSLTGRESFLSDDAYLIPVIEDDPLLQAPMDSWSDEEDDPEPQTQPNAASTSPPSSDLTLQLRRSQREVRILQRKLAQARQDLVDYRQIVHRALGVTDVRSWLDGRSGENEPAVPGKRGEDPNYFKSFEDDDVAEGPETSQTGQSHSRGRRDLDSAA